MRGAQAIGELGELVSQHADFSGGISSVDELVVMSSELEREGPVYEPLATAPLNG